MFLSAYGVATVSPDASWNSSRPGDVRDYAAGRDGELSLKVALLLKNINGRLTYSPVFEKFWYRPTTRGWESLSSAKVERSNVPCTDRGKLFFAIITPPLGHHSSAKITAYSMDAWEMGNRGLAPVENTADDSNGA